MPQGARLRASSVASLLSQRSHPKSFAGMSSDTTVLLVLQKKRAGPHGSHPLLNVITSVFLFHRELHGRTVCEVAAYKCPGEGQREGPVIHVLIRRQRHRRRDRCTLQIVCGRRD